MNKLIIDIANEKIFLMMIINTNIYNITHENTKINYESLTIIINNFLLSKKLKVSNINESKEEIIIKRVNKTKPTSILKKILLTIISLIIIITLVFFGLFSYDDYKRGQEFNPKSEYFKFPSYSHDNGTVEVDDVRYLRKDMSLFSGKLKGQYARGFYEVNYLNGRLNGDYYLWDSRGWLRITSYKDGKIDGPDKEWYPSKSRWIQGKLKLIAFYNGGLKQGDWKEWLLNGRLIKHWVMKDGIAVEKKVN